MPMTQPYELREIALQTPAYEQMKALRIDVLQKPLSLPMDALDFEHDKDRLMLGLYRGDALCGCLVFAPLAGSVYWMRQVAIDSALQGTGAGRQMMAQAETFARQNGTATVTLHARDYAVPFYEKCGYHIAGAGFDEAGIPHFPMEKAL